MSECPVMYDGRVYQKINKISFVKKGEHVIQEAELLDRCGRSIVTVLAKDVKEVNDGRNRTDTEESAQRNS